VYNYDILKVVAKDEHFMSSSSRYRLVKIKIKVR